MGCTPHRGESLRHIHLIIGNQGARSSSEESKNGNALIVPQTITEIYEGQIIAGIFSSRENADRAILAFKELNIPEKNIQEVIQSDEKQASEIENSLVNGGGFSKAQAVFYSNALGVGNILVAVWHRCPFTSLVANSQQPSPSD
jgi:hypothetical protein